MARPPEIAETQIISNDHEHQEFLDLTQNLTRITKSQARKKYGQHEFIPEEPSPSEGSSATPSKHSGEPVPHYLSDTQYIQNKTFRRLFGLSIFFSFAYFALRVVYIAMGKVKVAVPANSSPETLEEVDRQNRAALLYSTIILCAELGGFILVHVGQQMFTRQKTKFTRMPDVNVDRMKQVVVDKGTLQNIHVIVCTYSEDAATVEKCVVHLLEATLPVYATRTIWVADDGHTKPSGPGKRASCEKLAAAGHNVRYVGDRKRRPNQLNGKSSNLNHILLNHIYPDVNHSNEVSWKDIIVVMDCDHLVTPAYFQKCCSVLLNKDVAVCLVPQAFHNLIKPDFFDNRNANFMFRLMPYYFGAGCCFITGTNVMIRARTCFLACQFGEAPTGKRKFLHLWREKQANKRTRQLFSEVLIAEDIDLGSRIHALGYKSVFLDEVLALGEVPHAPRDFWKQRSRWHKAAHLYILDRHSVFWQAQPYMTFYQKSLYCIPMILHVTVFLSEPFMFTLPLVCLCFGVCPYGMDLWLWATHFLKLLFNFLISTHADKVSGRVAALQAQTASRVLYFISVKAVINTIMVYFRWKRPGAFKVTQKAGTDAGSDVQSQSQIPTHPRAPSEAYSAHDSQAPSHAPSHKYSNYSRPPSMQHMYGVPPGHGRSYSGSHSQHQGHLVTAQERARRASHRSSVAGALAEGNERQHFGPGNRGRMYGQTLTQDYVGSSLRNSKGAQVANNRDKNTSSHNSRDQKPPVRGSRSSGPVKQQDVKQQNEQALKHPVEEVSVNGDSNPALSGWTGPQVSPYEEVMDGMTVGSDATLETQVTPGGWTPHSTQNMFGPKPTPERSLLGSPHEPKHVATSGHADLQTLSHSDSQQQSSEVAPNPDYSPRERLASTSMLEDLAESPVAAGADSVKTPAAARQSQAPRARKEDRVNAADRAAGAQVRKLRNLPLAAVNSEALGATYESCISAASVAFASKSLARNHQGVVIPQSQGNMGNVQDTEVPGPPADTQQSSEVIRLNSKQHSEDVGAPVYENRASNPPEPDHDVEAVVDRTSAEIEHTASVEITPCSHLTAGAFSPATAPAAVQQPGPSQNAALQHQGSLQNQGSINRTSPAPKRRHHFGAPDHNIYVPAEQQQQQACDSFVESIGNHPRTPSLASMGSMNGAPQPTDVVSVATAPPAYDLTASTVQSRAHNSVSEAASCVVPVPPPGFQYALVPTAPVVQPLPQTGASTAQAPGIPIPAAAAHVPTTLAAVQEGHPLQSHELRKDVAGSSPAKSSITGSPPSQMMDSSECEFSSGYGMNSSTLLPPPRIDYSAHHGAHQSPQHSVHSTDPPGPPAGAAGLPNQPRAGALGHSPPTRQPPAHAHTFHADNSHVAKGPSFHAHMPPHKKAQTYDGHTDGRFAYPSRQSSKAMHICEGQMETDCHAYNIRVDAVPSQYRNKARTYESGAGTRHDYPPRRPHPATYDANGDRGGSMHAPSFRSEGGRHMKTPSFNATRPSQTNTDVAVPVASSQKAGPVGEDQDDAAPPPGYNCGLYFCHDALSSITEKRKACMPYEGTLDFPVLFIITAMNLVALIYGTVNLAREGEIISLRGTEEQNVKMIALVFALVEVTPGFLFLWYMVSFRCCKWTLWIVVPFTITLVALLVAFIEIRVGLQYITTALGINWQLPECTLSKCDVLGGGASKQA